jgi:hypothetical protein
MVIVASIYLRFYIEVGVGAFLPTRTPHKITSDSTTPTPQPCLAVSRWSVAADALFQSQAVLVGFMVDGVALDRFFFKCFRFPLSLAFRHFTTLIFYSFTSGTVEL